MSPDFIVPLPAAEVTVWCAESSLIQMTVLLVPITTLTTSGEYPGAPLGLPAPLGMETETVAPPLEEEVVVEVAPPGKV